MPDKLEDFFLTFENSLHDNSFVKISLGNYKGDDPELKQVFIKKIIVHGKEKFSFTYHCKTRDVVKNYATSESIDRLHDLLGGDFYVATLFTTGFDLRWENIHGKKFALKKTAPTTKQPPSAEHNRSKNRVIPAQGKDYLHHLGITDKNGNVLKTAQDKYRQINRYIELLDPLLPKSGHIKIADMGSGKGYLTFALYDHLTHNIKLEASVTGVEFRPDLVALCNETAEKSGFEKLHFVQGSIENFDGTGTNILIALHACDIATDDALYKGIAAKADLIVVAPCCHKQIRQEMEMHKAKNDIEFLTRHGILMERQAEMATDGLRALILEYFGYTVKVFEFISDSHTAKNVMITAVKNGKPPDPVILKKIHDAKSYLGIRKHHLEERAGL